MSANIQFKIEKLSQFAQEGSDSRRLSDAIYIRGLPWKILAIPRECGGPPPRQKCLGYFLQCNANNTDPAWSCKGYAIFKVIAQKEGKQDYVREITSHVFNAKENDWGFAQFMSFHVKIKHPGNSKKVDESAKGLTTKNAEYQKRKQELEIKKKLALQSVEKKYQKEIGQLEAENWKINADFAKEMTSLKDELKEKINWDQVVLVMGKKLVVNPMVNGKANCWNLATAKNRNSGIFISANGLKATNNGNANVYHNYNSVTADKGFYISVDFTGPVLYYFEVAIMSASYKGEILVGLSSGSIPDGTFVGELPNSYAIEDGCDHCWISEKTHQFEWPNGAIKPEWNGPGDIIGCGLVLNPAKELSLFFTGNGILLGKQIPISSTATSLYPTVSMYGFGYGSVVANFGDNPAKQFSYDIKKCPGIVFE